MELNEVQQRVRETWSSGDYDAVAQRIWSAGSDLVRRVGVRATDAVLDVACGTGNAAIPAAETGASVTGLDLTPSLFEAGRRRAAAAGVEIAWVEGDAQDLPYDDETFDVVLSTFGCMFAPDQERTAAELARVLRPGGRLGVAAWSPDGWPASFFAAMAPFNPAPPPGFRSPLLWGTPDYVVPLLGEAGVDAACEPAAIAFRFESVEHAVAEYAAAFGPLIMVRQRVESEGRWPDAVDAVRRSFEGTGVTADGSLDFPGQYLVTVGTKLSR